MGVSLRSEDMMQIVECRNGPVAYKAFIKGMHCPLCTTLLAYRSSDLKHVPEETLTAIVTTCKRTSSSTLSPPSPSSAASAAASAATRNAVYRLRTMKVCHSTYPNTPALSHTSTSLLTKLLWHIQKQTVSCGPSALTPMLVSVAPSPRSAAPAACAS